MTRLLIVDDNEQDRYMLQVLLQGYSYEVVSAANGAEALEKARRDPPDMIISDILMPVMDGFTLCRRWKGDDRLKEIPFVFYTATYTDRKDEEFALSLGAERFIVKPAEPDVFVGLLREVIEQHKAGRLTGPREPVAEEAVYLREYNEALIRKLEDKMVQLEKANRRLQTLSRRLVEVQEIERREIARELHDEIGQVLTGLKLALETGTRLPMHEARISLKEAQALVNELMTRVRDLSLDLRPAMLDDLGLLPTLLWHFERYTAQTNVHVVFRHIGLEGRRFPPAVETAVYRIVQEALTNAARHAGVREVTVRLWTDDGMLNVQIEDQGTGFDPEAVLAAADTSGLAGMRERAELLSGRLTVESSPETGTRVTAEFPVRALSQIEKKDGHDDNRAG